ncbi:MAG TPA: DUF488 domain-containing protein [Candidatus Elarobacter sp.]|jgi:uncharacterized protein (DUF488 family)
MRVWTIGVYGTDKAAFFAELEESGIDVFLDIRRRRAVRGPHYAFANARRLTHELGVRGIAYRHILELAPPPELLDLQHAADEEQRVRYSERTALAPEYVRRYRAEVLDRFDFPELARKLTEYQAPVLFCIERIPEACHRSLVAPKLARAFGGVEVVHLIPEATS